LFKKLLLTLSVLMLAGGAFAADSDWSFYGVAHSSINVLNNGEDSQLGLTSNTSRFGFKGTAPLNEDFTAFWQFESLVDFAGNTGEEGTVIGTRNRLKALLLALLALIDRRRAAELQGVYTTRLALREDAKLLPARAVSDYHCAQHGVPIGEAWLAEVKRYQRDVLAKRG